MPAYPNHQDIRPAYVQSTDTGAVGAGVFWVDTSFPQPYPLKVRNLTDTGWDIIGSANPLGGPLPGPEGERGEEGEQGPPGAAGESGAAGAAGAAGQPGPPGSDGEEGEQGDIGPPGNQGPQGNTGSIGLQGPPGVGEDGEEGDQGTPGPQGNVGATGTAGVAGAQGPPGADGEDGESEDSFSPPTAPGGANTNVQYNKGGVFGGEPDLSWQHTTKRLGIGSGTNDSQLHVSSLLNTGARGGTISNHHDDDFASALQSMSRSRGTSAAPTDCGSADTIAETKFYAYSGGYGQQGAVAIKTDGAASGGNFPTSFTLSLNGGLGVVDRLKITGAGSVVLSHGSALSPTDTDGFFYLGYATGIPSGVPVAQGATVPMVVNGAVGQNRVFVYNFTTGAWFDVGVPWVRDNSSFLTYKRKRINFVNGRDIRITTVDDAVDDEVEVTVGSSSPAIPPGFDGEEGEEGPPGPPGPTGPAGSGSPGSLTTGVAVVAFGAFPGLPEAIVDVSGQTGFISTSMVRAWLDGGTATADHTVDEHMNENLDVRAYFKTNGTFTISVRAVIVPQLQPILGIKSGRPRMVPQVSYGQFNVRWIWSN